MELCVCVGPSREAPKDDGVVEETADGDRGRRTDPVEETTTTSWKWWTSRRKSGHPAVLVNTHTHTTVNTLTVVLTVCLLVAGVQV